MLHKNLKHEISGDFAEIKSDAGSNDWIRRHFVCASDELVAKLIIFIGKFVQNSETTAGSNSFYTSIKQSLTILPAFHAT